MENENCNSDEIKISLTVPVLVELGYMMLSFRETVLDIINENEVASSRKEISKLSVQIIEFIEKIMIELSELDEDAINDREIVKSIFNKEIKKKSKKESAVDILNKIEKLILQLEKETK